MDSVYRDGTDSARRELGELWLARVQQVAGVSPTCRRIYGRRMARAVAGGVMACGGVAVLLWGAAIAVQDGIVSDSGANGALTSLLLLTWVVALVAYGATRVWAMRRFDRAVARTVAPSGELYADLDRARHESAAAVVAQWVVRRERVSLALPLIGVSLVLPLTLHLLFFLLVGDGKLDALAFDSWIVVSAALVGHSHLVLAVCAWFYSGEPRNPWGPWLWTVGSSAVPGIVLLGLPVFLVAVTGVFIPLMFSAVAARVRGERCVLVPG